MPTTKSEVLYFSFMLSSTQETPLFSSSGTLSQVKPVKVGHRDSGDSEVRLDRYSLFAGPGNNNRRLPKIHNSPQPSSTNLAELGYHLSDILPTLLPPGEPAPELYGEVWGTRVPNGRPRIGSD